MLAGPAALCRPHRERSRAHPRGKPGFLTHEDRLLRETDSLLERGIRTLWGGCGEPAKLRFFFTRSKGDGITPERRVVSQFSGFRRLCGDLPSVLPPAQLFRRSC